MSAASEFQTAVFTLLEGDSALAGLLGSGKIYDQTPAHVAFPYVTFGRTSSFDWDTATERGTEQIFTLHAWSKRQGKKEVLAIMARIAALLDDATLALATHHLVALRLEASDTRFDDDQAVHHGAMRFRALIEE